MINEEMVNFRESIRSAASASLKLQNKAEEQGDRVAAKILNDIRIKLYGMDNSLLDYLSLSSGETLTSDNTTVLGPRDGYNEYYVLFHQLHLNNLYQPVTVARYYVEDGRLVMSEAGENLNPKKAQALIEYHIDREFEKQLLTLVP